MSDFDISKLVGMRTYCQLYDNNPELYTQRAECGDYCYSDDISINYVTILVAENTDMYQVKKDLQIAVRTGKVSPLVSNLVYSSWSYDYPAMSLNYCIVWIIIVVFLVFVFTYNLIINGTVHKVLQQEFTPSQYYWFA